MRTITGIFASRDTAAHGLRQLRGVVHDDRINVLAPGASECQIADVPIADGEAPGTGAALGGVVGGAVGLAAGMPLGAAVASLVIPGVGPISALSFALTIDPGQFRSGRHFAAWLGLTPKEHSTGGKQRLGGISRAGDERLRQLLVIGATAVIRFAKPARSSKRLIKAL